MLYIIIDMGHLVLLAKDKVLLNPIDFSKSKFKEM